MDILKMMELFVAPKTLWVIVSFVFFIMFLIMIVRFHLSSQYKKFDLIELFSIDQITGRPSDSKVRLNVAFIVTSWAFVFLAMNDKLSEWYLFAYMGAWVTDRFLARYTTPKQETKEETKE